MHIQNLKTVLDLAGDLIDIVYYYDDIATQNGLMISPEMYEEFIQPTAFSLLTITDVASLFAIVIISSLLATATASFRS